MYFSLVRSHGLPPCDSTLARRSRPEHEAQREADRRIWPLTRNLVSSPSPAIQPCPNPNYVRPLSESTHSNSTHPLPNSTLSNPPSQRRYLLHNPHLRTSIPLLAQRIYLRHRPHAPVVLHRSPGHHNLHLHPCAPATLRKNQIRLSRLLRRALIRAK